MQPEFDDGLYTAANSRHTAPMLANVTLAAAFLIAIVIGMSVPLGPKD